MLTLLKKDFILHQKVLAGTFILLILCMVFDLSALFVAIIFIISTSHSFLSVDDRSNIQILLSALPYTRKEIVTYRYLSVLVIAFLYIGCIFIGDWLFNAQLMYWKEIFFVVSIVCIIMSVIFPFSYLFKSMFIHYLFGGLLVLYLILVSTFIPNLNDLFREGTKKIMQTSDSQLFAWGSIILLILYITSWYISFRIYEKKVF
ncbi:MAG: ABC-2 transporter permease [Solibacillus sp.]|uniref:ABC-2 transporter permease n=1 Tax=Solibacillus sp. TaxID=1909654 RepID=UPI0033161411